MFGMAYEGGVLYGVTNDGVNHLVTYDLATGDQTTVASTAQVGWNVALSGSTTPVLIPEPGVISLMLVGTAGLLLARSRRK